MQFHFMQFLPSFSDQEIIMLLERKSFEHTLCAMYYNKHAMYINSLHSIKPHVMIIICGYTYMKFIPALYKLRIQTLQGNT